MIKNKARYKGICIMLCSLFVSILEPKKQSLLEDPCLVQRPKSLSSYQQLIRGRNVLIRRVFPAQAEQRALFLFVPASGGNRGIVTGGHFHAFVWFADGMHACPLASASKRCTTFELMIKKERILLISLLNQHQHEL